MSLLAFLKGLNWAVPVTWARNPTGFSYPVFKPIVPVPGDLLDELSSRSYLWVRSLADKEGRNATSRA